MIHDIEFIFYNNNDDQPGFEESTIVEVHPYGCESRHEYITTHAQFIDALNEAIKLREAQLKYLTGLKIIAQHVDFKQLRDDATERGGLDEIVEEFWKGYDED